MGNGDIGRQGNGFAKEVPESILAQAREMASIKLPWTTIEARLGFSSDVLRRRIDPSYGRNKRNRVREARSLRSERALSFIRTRVPPAEAIIAIANVPADTRSFTGRAMGDPLPGRSALDQRPKFSTGGSGENSEPLLVSLNHGVLMEDRHSNSEAVE